MIPLKPLLEKRGSAATKEGNASSKRPRKKKRRVLIKDNECKSIEVNKHQVDIEHL
jgi:hypothetical protein